MLHAASGRDGIRDIPTYRNASTASGLEDGRERRPTSHGVVPSLPMSPAAPAAQPPQSPSEARPVEGHERIVLVDALRGFALFGVFLSNAFGWFDGRHFFSRAQLEAAAANASLLDTAAGYGISLFVNGKFITLFSFLFGLGFFVQMDRARARGGTIAPLYVRRLGVLLALGLAHLLLLWWGDILSLYALLGFCLLAFRSRSDRTLLVWAALLVLAGPVLIAAVLCL